jgi:hypothetical protein
MKAADRLKLLGTYRTPRVRVGRVLMCEARDCDVIVTGYSDARIPWPIGRRRGKPARGLVVFGGLARAVRRVRRFHPPGRVRFGRPAPRAGQE